MNEIQTSFAHIYQCNLRSLPIKEVFALSAMESFSKKRKSKVGIKYPLRLCGYRKSTEYLIKYNPE